MKKTIVIQQNNTQIERVINYIPFRFIASMFLFALETILVMGIVVVLTIFLPYFYIAVVVTQLFVSIAIINSDDNPDYKLPWLFFVVVVPIIGFMSYFMFYSRKINKRHLKKIQEVINQQTLKDDSIECSELILEDSLVYSQALMIKKLASTHLYKNCSMMYYPSGEEMHCAMLKDLMEAKEYIFMEYFILEQGQFWNSILEILTNKASSGVEVRVIYDDIGCMMTLPGNYYRQLNKIGIHTIPFSRLRGQANNKFNNRSHRKIMIIDGCIGYTGGVNIADEYINQVLKFGHWKDVGIRIEGEAVNELTRLFLIDYSLNTRKKTEEFSRYYRCKNYEQSGYCVPFGDGPKPLFQRQVAKNLILNMLNQAKRYVYITSPYLIVDNELMQALENAAIRGVDIKIITPHIPDKRIVFLMTRSSYRRLLASGVEIYEYEKGFIHAKLLISDDTTAMIGTINMDYRSLVHHFENGVWIYKHRVIDEMKTDFMATQNLSIHITDEMIKEHLPQKLIRSITKMVSPLL